MAANALHTALLTVLADTFVLQTRTQLAHWNVEGMEFHSLHEFFEEQYDALSEAVDEWAERLRALDVSVPDILLLAQKTTLAKSKANLNAKGFLQDLLNGHEATIGSLKALKKAAAKAGDDETEDMAVGRITEHQKQAWMLRAHLR